MIDLISIKINNLTDPHFLGLHVAWAMQRYNIAPAPGDGCYKWASPTPYPVWENILEFGYCYQAPRTDPPGGLDDVSQISEAVKSGHPYSLFPLHFLTLQTILIPIPVWFITPPIQINRLETTVSYSVFLTYGPVAQPGHPGGVRLPFAPVGRYLRTRNTNPQVWEWERYRPIQATGLQRTTDGL